MEILHEINSIDMTFKKITWEKGMFQFHWHEKLEIIIPLDKPFGVLMDGISYEVKPGDVIIIGAQIIHSFRIDEDDTNIFLGQFPYRILLGSASMPTNVKPVIYAAEIEKDEVFSQQLKSIFEIMSEEQTVMQGEENPFMQSMYRALYFLIMRKFSTPPESRAEKKEKQDFYKIVNFANEHFSEDINVQTVAQTIYMDRGRVSKIFAKYAGMPLNHYINTLRFNKAIQLIENGETTTYAALESGFQSVRTFNDFYKKTKRDVTAN